MDLRIGGFEIKSLRCAQPNSVQQSPLAPDKIPRQLLENPTKIDDGFPGSCHGFYHPPEVEFGSRILDLVVYTHGGSRQTDKSVPEGALQVPRTQVDREVSHEMSSGFLEVRSWDTSVCSGT